MTKVGPYGRTAASSAVKSSFAADLTSAALEGVVLTMDGVG
jgi:hypothetical protein